MLKKILPLLLIIVMVMGAVGSVSATQHGQFKCPWCNYDTDSANYMKCHIENNHQCCKVVIIEGKPGAKGDKGDPGATGATGAKGEQGIQGTQGETGLQGLMGDPGQSGINGTNGTNGINGKDGITKIVTKTIEQAANTIPMEKTGSPIIPGILATLAVLGAVGYTYLKK